MERARQQLRERPRLPTSVTRPTTSAAIAGACAVLRAAHGVGAGRGVELTGVDIVLLRGEAPGAAGLVEAARAAPLRAVSGLGLVARGTTRVGASCWWQASMRAGRVLYEG